MTGLFAQLLNGVQYGLLLFLIGSGLTLIFGVMGVINLAHGSLFMIGAYLAYVLTAASVPLPLALAAAVAGGAVLGAAQLGALAQGEFAVLQVFGLQLINPAFFLLKAARFLDVEAAVLQAVFNAGQIGRAHV